MDLQDSESEPDSPPSRREQGTLSDDVCVTSQTALLHFLERCPRGLWWRFARPLKRKLPEVRILLSPLVLWHRPGSIPGSTFGTLCSIVFCLSRGTLCPGFRLGGCVSEKVSKEYWVLSSIMRQKSQRKRNAGYSNIITDVITGDAKGLLLLIRKSEVAKLLVKNSLLVEAGAWGNT